VTQPSIRTRGHLWALRPVLYSVNPHEGLISMRLFKTTLAALCLAAVTAGQAETLLLDDLDAHRGTADTRPTRGMSMDRVEARFGAPITRVNAVGEPPITRWEYADFTVYFEHRLVIHAVQKR
jgi:hypothetical protein